MPKTYFIGIGGAGMSGLALAHLDRGEFVTGSDPSDTLIIRRLQSKGATIYLKQIGANIAHEVPDLVVYTAAVKLDHPELLAARSLNIPVVGRAEYLGQLADSFAGPRIAITGTHGKTTTTTMVTEACIAAELDPTSLIGADYAPFDGNYRHGSSGLFITEACEAYSSFLHLSPDVAVITNVDADHLDHYQSARAVQEAFVQFCNLVRPGGTLIHCSDDPGAVTAVHCCNRADISRVGYGIENGSTAVTAQNVTYGSGYTSASVKISLPGRSEITVPLRLLVPGKHNLLNALAALATVSVCDGDVVKAALALSEFCGTVRRFQVLGSVRGRTLVDDYAHHPTEINATIDAARQKFPGQRLYVAFQPHLFSRTRDFLHEFVESLSYADGIIVTDIYPAREAPIPGVHSSLLVHSLAKMVPEKTVLYVETVPDVPAALLWVSRPGDIIMTMGAGDIEKAAHTLSGVMP